ncbi:hypothetical protein HUN08_12685 [Gordonia sp. X0973]|uniref:hypothetical protein n=1 Tax=Gordonia sp. X0973 TaxID=2742602 RepID=UPI000F53FBF8|nr:hypothetical protein [Gordonia sp. X0973]QKT07947.1 hypothetical protein HUN08_12685 [Gordonia sp. X0973]
MPLTRAIASVSRSLLVAVALLLLVGLLTALSMGVGLKNTAMLCAILSVLMLVTGSHAIAALDVRMTLLTGSAVILACLPALLLNRWLIIPVGGAVVFLSTLMGVIGPRFGAWGMSTAMAVVYTAGTAAIHRDGSGVLLWGKTELVVTVILATLVASALGWAMVFRKDDGVLDKAAQDPPDLELLLLNGLVVGTAPARIVDPAAAAGTLVRIPGAVRRRVALAIASSLTSRQSAELHQGLRMFVALTVAWVVILLNPGMPLTLVMLMTTLAMLTPETHATWSQVSARLLSSAVGAGLAIGMTWLLSGQPHGRTIAMSIGVLALLVQVAYLARPIVSAGASVLATSAIPLLGWSGSPVRYALVYLAVMVVLALLAVALDRFGPVREIGDEEALGAMRLLIETPPRTREWRRLWARAATVESTTRYGAVLEPELADAMRTIRLATAFSVADGDRWNRIALQAYDRAVEFASRR